MAGMLLAPCWSISRGPASNHQPQAGQCSMATKKTFTQDDLLAAQQRLAALPDLSRNKITQADFIGQLKDQIIALSKEKGYNTNEIKAVLLDLGVKVSGKDVDTLVNPPKRARAPRGTQGPGAKSPAPTGTAS